VHRDVLVNERFQRQLTALRLAPVLAGKACLDLDPEINRSPLTRFVNLEQLLVVPLLAFPVRFAECFCRYP